jgi:hypothetical protein
MLNQSMGRIIETKIIPDKCQWLTRPGTCIVRSRNNVMTLLLLDVSERICLRKSQ